MQKSLLKESVDRQNKDPLAAEVKSGYEKITKSRGDGGFLYKALDSKNASKYKKLAVPEKKLLISYGEDLTDSPDGYHGYENCAGIEGTVDIKNKNVSLRFGWEETGFDDSPAGAGVKTDRIIKDLSWTIKSVELYGYDYGRWCRMREYVVTTKEGPVLHLWCDTGDDTYSCDVNAKGLAEGKYVKPSEDSDYTVCTFTGWHWNEED